MRLYWYVLWPLTSVLQERGPSCLPEWPSLYTPNDDVARNFKLRETPCDEEMTCVEPELDEDYCLLHFQLLEPPGGYLGPILAFVSVHGVFHVIYCKSESKKTM